MNSYKVIIRAEWVCFVEGEYMREDEAADLGEYKFYVDGKTYQCTPVQVDVEAESDDD